MINCKRVRPLQEEMSFHPACDIFPRLETEEFEVLCRDIHKNGLRESIWLHSDGSILDGRHRYLACIQTGVEPRYRTWDGKGSPISFVVSLNLRRRHLNASQRAMVAARIATLEDGQHQVGKFADVLTQAEAAQLLNVGERSIRSARTVLEEGSEKLKQEVDQGRIAVSTGSVIATRPCVEQDEIIARGEEEIMREAKRIKLARRKMKDTARENRNRSIIASLPPISDRYRLYVGDVANAVEVADESVDWFITDPPYPKEYLPVYEGLAKTAARVLKPGGSCLIMVGHIYFLEVLDRIRPYLDYHWICAYLTPGPAASIYPTQMNSNWKPLLWFSKGKFTGSWAGDVLKSESADKTYHEWGQSESGMLDIIERYTQPGEVIFDPFLGGGTTAVAALKLNRRFIGMDIDPQCIRITLNRIAAIVDLNQRVNRACFQSEKANNVNDR